MSDDTQRADLVMHGVYLVEKAIEKLPSAKDINVHSNDAISRTAAIDAIYAEFEYVYCFNCDHEGNEEWCEDCHRKYVKWSASRNTIERVLNGLPSVQPRKGKWIKISPANIYECSECGKNVMTGDISAYDFCHGCGADMRGDLE